MHEDINECQRCNTTLTPYGNHFNLKKLPLNENYNTTFILYECLKCKLKYSYHMKIHKSFI